MSDHFKFYRLMFDTGMELDPSMRLQYFEAVMNYGLNGILPEDPVMKALIKGAVFSIDRSNEIASVNSENGKKHTGNQYSQGDKKRNRSGNADLNAVERIGTNGSELEQNGTEVKKYRSIEDKKVEVNKNKDISCNGTLHPAPSFDEFWNLYPVKRDKKKARDKYAKLSADKKQLAVDGISRLMGSKQWQEGYIPLPTTYLNGERWEDEVTSDSSDVAKEKALAKHREKIREQFLSDIRSDDGLETKAVDRRGEVFGS